LKTTPESRLRKATPLYYHKGLPSVLQHSSAFVTQSIQVTHVESFTIMSKLEERIAPPLLGSGRAFKTTHTTVHQSY
jgi:hypothetical protein